jgi:S-adenosylmethionine-diacylgycerolhomoserine-N-methlytransferase
MSEALVEHDALMDRVYRHQKHIYDFTRKYYLFGRDRMIADMDVGAGESVLELGCGTGRNLAEIARTWPGARLHGLDISREMLGLAARKLGPRAALAAGDATAFDASTLFGARAFDHVVLSYALSMIPDWQGTIAHAATVLAPGGRLHIVDFGDLTDLPRPMAGLLRGWLRLFHVTPRDAMSVTAARLAATHGLTMVKTHGPLRYYQLITLRRPG